MITKPSTTKWAYTDSSTLTCTITRHIMRGEGGLFCHARQQTLFLFFHGSMLFSVPDAGSATESLTGRQKSPTPTSWRMRTSLSLWKSWSLKCSQPCLASGPARMPPSGIWQLCEQKSSCRHCLRSEYCVLVRFTLVGCLNGGKSSPPFLGSGFIREQPSDVSKMYEMVSLCLPCLGWQ